MRITADVIDEECFLEGNGEPSTDHECKLKCRNQSAENAVHYHIMFNSMLKKFELLNMSDNTDHADKSSAETLNKMEPAAQKSDHVESNIPPICLLQYLAKMKEEIKKDVTAEVLHMINMSQKDKKSEAQKCLGKDNELLKKADASHHCIPKFPPFRQYTEEVIHHDIYCDNCDKIIHGIRYKCGICSDYDLCEECENIPGVHDESHIFLKIRFPFSVQSKVEHNYGKLPSGVYQAKFIGDETVPDETIITPGKKFVKSWRISNVGTEIWTNDTVLKYVGGSVDLKPLSRTVEVPHLKPGAEGIVNVSFIAPVSCGIYESYWNFFNKDIVFGHRLWCNIRVLENLVPCIEVPQECVPAESHSNISSSVPHVACSANQADDKSKDVTQIADVLTAVQEEHERGNLVPRKLVVMSHTATPNNTPFDLSPPKSPEPQEANSNDGNTINNSENDCLKTNKQGVETDDKASILSVSSSDSDTEFVVIPMPSCFSYSDTISSSGTQSSLFQELEAKDLKSLNKKSSVTSQTQVVSESVSQETGAPEEAESYNIQTAIHIKERQDNNALFSDVTVNCSSSSSSVSVIESGNSSPVIEIIASDNTNPKYIHESAAKQSEAEFLKGLPSRNKSNFSRFQADSSSRSTVRKNLNSNDASVNTATTTAPVEPPTVSLNSPSQPKEEERTIQVLPEGLVTGALIAAATVYNTARAVFSGIQPAKNEQDVNSSSSSHNEASRNDTRETNIRDLDPAEQLFEMGFYNRTLNERLLKEHDNDVTVVVEKLVNLDDNDWYASRHTDSSNPAEDF